MIPFGRHQEYRNEYRKTTKGSELQQLQSEQIIEDSNRLVEEVQWKTDLLKKEVDRRLEERIDDIKFHSDEIKIKKRDATLEEEALKVYRERVRKCLTVVSNLDEVNRNVIATRYSENPYTRNTVDIVDKELEKESAMIAKYLRNLNEAEVRLNDQIQEIRAQIFKMDRDLELKERAQSIDESCLTLKESMLNLKIHDDQFQKEGIQMVHWKRIPLEHISETTKQLNSGKALRSFIDILLLQTAENLRSQIDATNIKFEARITEMKNTKTRLENVHKDNTNHINALDRNMVNLEKEKMCKEGYIALCTTRLKARSSRPMTELCSDSPQLALLTELAGLRTILEQLKVKIEQAQNNHKYLHRAQLDLEANINMETHLIHVNEVLCMTIRENLQLHNF